MGCQVPEVAKDKRETEENKEEQDKGGHKEKWVTKEKKETMAL